MKWKCSVCVVSCNQDFIHSIIICIRLRGRKEIKCWNIHNFFVIFHSKKEFLAFFPPEYFKLIFRFNLKTVFVLIYLTLRSVYESTRLYNLHCIFFHAYGGIMRANLLSLLLLIVMPIDEFFPSFAPWIFIPFPIQCILMSVSNDFPIFGVRVGFRYYCLCVCVVPCGMCISFWGFVAC